MVGNSSRFPNVRPKWLLTHPKSGFMGTESIKGLNLDSFDKIYFVAQKSHQEKYGFTEGFINEFYEIKDKIEFVLLDHSTNSQPETVYECIQKVGIKGAILVKDSDNFFEANVKSDGNYVCYFDLNDRDDLNARNKSYLQFDVNGYISNIVEKKVVSSTFSVGGYGFDSADEFCEYFKSCVKLQPELYMSNVIFEMLLHDKKFTGIKTSDYEDWGTLVEWNNYKKTFKTLFIDLDGVLIENTSAYIAPFLGTGKPLEKNIKLLQDLDEKGRTCIIITTSRPYGSHDITVEELKRHKIPHEGLMMNLSHCQRIVVNDFANSNPFPSCSAINIKRDSDTLEEYWI